MRAALPACLLLLGLASGRRTSVQEAPSLCEAEELVRSGCQDLRTRPGGEGDADSLKKEDVAAYFMADQSFEAFWQKMVPGGRDSATCMELCVASVEHLKTVAGLTMPPRQALSCKSDGGDGCAWREQSVKFMEDEAHETDLEGEEEQTGYGHDTIQELVSEEPRPLGNLTYDVDELALRVANAFSVFPAEEGGGSSVIELPPVFGDQVTQGHQQHYHQIVKEGEAWLNSALTHLPGQTNIVAAFIGSEDPETMEFVRRRLLTMAQVMHNLKIKVAVGGLCDQGFLAFVRMSLNKRTKAWVRSEMEGGKHIVHFCPSFWEDKMQEKATVRYGTMVHETAHHHGAKDSKWGNLTSYGRYNVFYMAELTPEDARQNADNIMWMVYFMNRCGNAVTDVDLEPPCAMAVAPAGGGLFSAKVVCSKAIEGLAISFFNDQGLWAAPRIALPPKMKRGGFKVPPRRLPIGTTVEMAYIVDCVIWKVASKWTGGQQIVHSKPWRILSVGGVTGFDDEEDEEEDSQPAWLPKLHNFGLHMLGSKERAEEGFLPCSLKFAQAQVQPRPQEHVPGFFLEVTCKKEVVDPKLTIEGSFMGSAKYGPFRYPAIRPGHMVKLFAGERQAFTSFTFVLKGSVEGRPGSVLAIYSGH